MLLQDNSTLQANASLALSHLGVTRREYVLAIDETCWVPMREPVQGLGIVGGHYVAGDDRSLYDLDDWDSVDKNALSSLSLSFGISRTDANSVVFDINMAPMPKKGSKADALLRTGLQNTWCHMVQYGCLWLQYVQN